MLKVTIQRQTTSDEGTFGQFTLPSGKTYHSLELPWRDNHNQFSCIPAGTYTCTWGFSPHLQRSVYHVNNVPNRSGVLIHSGNFGGDTTKGLTSDILGCILAGLSVGQLANRNSTQQHPVLQQAVLQSTKAIAMIADELNNADFELTILPIAAGQNP